MILTLAWLVLTITVITIILLIDYRRFESSFQDLALNVKTNLISKIKENEAVLEGFSAYISGMGWFSAARANTFAMQIKQGALNQRPLMLNINIIQ